jgi:hypothetical protein
MLTDNLLNYKNYLTMETKLKELFNKRNLTLEDKQYIKDLSTQLNVKFVEREFCSDCYKDQIMVLLKVLTQQKIDNGEITADYVLRPDIDVIYNGLRINNATLSNDIAEEFLRMGLRHWFMKVKESQNAVEQTPTKSKKTKVVATETSTESETENKPESETADNSNTEN